MLELSGGIQCPVRQFRPGPGSGVPTFPGPGPVQREGEWNEANGTLATIRPELAQDGGDSKRCGNRLDGIAYQVLAKFRRGRDQQFPAGGGPILIDGADFVFQERTGHPKRIVGAIEGFQFYIDALLVGEGQPVQCFLRPASRKVL